MEIYLAGAENPAHQKILSSCGATRVAVNAASLLRRKISTWELDLPGDDWEWVAYCDGPVPLDDLRMILDRAAKPPQAVVGPLSWCEMDGYLPLWNGEGEMPSDRSQGLVITDRVFGDRNLVRRSLAARMAGGTLGVITGSTDTAIGRFDLVISGAWWSVMKFGETQVWDGRKMHRYSAERKNEVRSKHVPHIAALGIDTDKVLLDDPDESARLAISSWRSYAESMSRATVLPITSRLEATTDPDPTSSNDGPGLLTVDMPPIQQRQRSPIPVMSQTITSATVKLGDGTEILEEQAVVLSVSESIRACDNCHLAMSGCPGFHQGHSCAYSIPVEIRSKDQLQSVMQAMVELQTQRVLQARFAEEIQGQELSPEFGRELDRLFSSVEKMRDIMDNRDTVKMTVEARGRSGVLSRLFGDRVGANAKMLTHPVDSEDVTDAILDDDPA